MKITSSIRTNLSSRFPDWQAYVWPSTIFFAAIILAPFIAREFLPAILIVAGILAIFGIVFFIRNPGIGFPILVVASLLIPFSISTGTNTRINSAILIVILLVAAWLVEMLIINRQITLLPERSIYAALLFMVSVIISFGFGQLDWYPTQNASLFAQIGQILIMVLSMAAFITAGQRMESPKWLKITVYTFIIIGGIYSLGFAVPPLRHYVNRVFQRAVLDSLFWVWLIALSFGQFWLNKSLKPIIRAGFLLIFLSAIYTVLITKQSWTSGWFPALVALFVIFFLTEPKYGIVGIFVFALILLVRYQVIQSYVFVGDNEYSMLTRIEAWKILFQIIGKNPLFGVGPANYYFYTPFYNILGYSVSFNSHNNYIDLLAEVGVVGFSIFIWWAIETAKLGFSLLKVDLEPFEKSFVITAIGGLAGTMVAAFLGDWLIPFIYNIGMEGFRASVLSWVFLGSLIFIKYDHKKKEMAS
jgi:O-antigen ligase